MLQFEQPGPLLLPLLPEPFKIRLRLAQMAKQPDRQGNAIQFLEKLCQPWVPGELDPSRRDEHLARMFPGERLDFERLPPPGTQRALLAPDGGGERDPGQVTPLRNESRGGLLVPLQRRLEVVEDHGCRPACQRRAHAIADLGAEVRRVSGNYDDAVRKAANDAIGHGWHVVSDTSYEGYVSVPRDVMQGYSVMVEEVLNQMEGVPTHAFVQGGVGGLAAAVCAHFWQRFGERRPKCVVVEPDQADCLYRSAIAGEPTVVHGPLDTIMAGLACGEVSLLAWKILDSGADAFMTITDAAAAEAMRILADARFGDEPVVAGESAVAGFAGFLNAAGDAGGRASLSLGPDSVVLLFGTEGATDPEIYRQIVGRSADAVKAAAA